MLESSFDEILDAARAGGEWAWQRIYGDLAPVLLSYLRARGGVEPEDLLGEVFLQVARDLHRFEGDGRSFRSWIFTIAHHRLIDERRNARRGGLELLPYAELGEAMGSGDVERDAMDRVGTERVRMLIGRLTSDQQDVLLLRLIADLTIEDIAQVLGKRPGAVKALQRRALAALKREISREGVPL